MPSGTLFFAMVVMNVALTLWFMYICDRSAFSERLFIVVDILK